MAEQTLPEILPADLPAALAGPTARAVLAGLPAAAPMAEVWSRLAAGGVLAGLYREAGGELRLRPAALRELVGAVDARGRTGVTLAVCVLAASVVPALHAGAADSAPAAAALADVLAGRATVALAVTDAAAAGSDLAGLATTVTAAEGVVEVTGGKRWIANATGCDHLLVLARHRPGRHFTSFGWVLVPARAAGVRVAAADTPLFAGSGTGHVELDGVRLPAAHLVGRPGRGLASFARHVSRERFAGALWAVALMRRALDDTRRRLQQRDSGGQPLWEREPLRHRYAAALVELRAVQALTEQLADRVLGGYDPAAAALVKVAAATAADRVLGVCAGLQGADGYLPGGAQQLRAEAAVFGIGGGTVDLMLDSLAGHADVLLAEVAPC